MTNSKPHTSQTL